MTRKVRISADPKDFDLDFICREIQGSYWAQNRSKELILRSLEHSLCFSIFYGSRQIGFARVITDRSTFAYLCDVVITADFRRKGFGQILFDEVLKHPDLQTVGWTLRTRDGHGFYKKFGFVNTTRPERYMERNSPKA